MNKKKFCIKGGPRILRHFHCIYLVLFMSEAEILGCGLKGSFHIYLPQNMWSAFVFLGHKHIVHALNKILSAKRAHKDSDLLP